MAHTIYQTQGIILAKKDFGEADRMYSIFTEKFGMINAVAQGVRYLKSKLRYNLGLFSCGNFALIVSKDLWRIVDVEEIVNSRKILQNPERLKIFSRIANFLTRMIKGEERDDFIWEEVQNFVYSLPDKNQGLEDLEINILARVLHNLGYMEDIPSSKRALIYKINRAIKESML